MELQSQLNIYKIQWWIMSVLLCYHRATLGLTVPAASGTSVIPRSCGEGVPLQQARQPNR